MNRPSRRQEPTPRYGVNHHCRGRGHHARLGHSFDFRGMDVSNHGFGCVAVGSFQLHDVLELDMGGQHLSFEIVWIESHLGIENTYRLGLLSLDRVLDVRAKMSALGFVTGPLDGEFAA
jgi:hypothetical protein